MIVHQIDIESGTVLEPKNDPPVGSDAHRPEVPEITSQPVQPEAGQIHILDRRHLVEAGKDTPDLVNVPGIDTATVVPFEQPL